MIALIPLLCLMLGVAAAYLFKAPVHAELSRYVSVSCLAGLDTLCGGIRSNLERRFDGMIMVSGFISNVAIALVLVMLGERIGADIVLVCALIFGQRIFTNLSVIRRLLLTKWQDDREARKRQLAAQDAQAKV